VYDTELNTFLQRVRIARSVERCTSYSNSVCLSFLHVPVLNEDTIVRFSVYGREMLLVSEEVKFIWTFAWNQL